jgi:hypothetical protein
MLNGIDSKKLRNSRPNSIGYSDIVGFVVVLKRGNTVFPKVLNAKRFKVFLLSRRRATKPEIKRAIPIEKIHQRI